MKTLKRQINNFKKKIPIEVLKVKHSLARTILFNLIYDTPVDTSEALSNWQVSLRQAKNKKIEPYFVGNEGSTHSQSSNLAYNIGNVIVQRAKVGELIYITNNVDYLDLLNQGYSLQADEGFIEEAVERAVEITKKAFKL